MIGKSLLPGTVLRWQLPSEFWTAMGILLVIGGILQILFRRQEVRDRQRSYDANRWWAYPPLWQENVITVLGGLLLLGFGILFIVVSLIFEPPPE
jgi:hypothetical protein